MKRLLIIAIACSLTGCATWAGMSENETQTAMWVSGFVLTAVAISANDGDSTTTTIIDENCGHPVHCD